MIIYVISSTKVEADWQATSKLFIQQETQENYNSMRCLFNSLCKHNTISHYLHCLRATLQTVWQWKSAAHS